MKRYDILVIGAGPAGLAAAQAAIAQGKQVGIVDDNPLAGGQIWRGGPEQQSDLRARQLWEALQGKAEYLAQTRVLYAPAPGCVTVQAPATAPVIPAQAGIHVEHNGAHSMDSRFRGNDEEVSANTLHYDHLILATGARERLLPFPGWTLPGVTGAGGLQALAKGGYPLQGKRVVVAGSGPLLLAVAATLRARGAQVAAIVEQAGTLALARFAASLLATPSRLRQSLQLAAQLSGVPYLRNSYVRAAHGEHALRAVQIQRGSTPAAQTLECDYLACGYGLLPNIELAQSLGCEIAARGAQNVVAVDEWQRTSMDRIYCAGEGTGVGGVDLALVEGRIAGLAASGRHDEARRLFRQRAHWQTFAQRLEKTFALRPELRALAKDDTIVCRCEDVCHGELRAYTTWRSAKLQTRCGMGPCQGRICGGATELLYGWRPDAARLPVAPARVASIID